MGKWLAIALLAALAVFVARELPSLKRYLKIERM
jgi:hypothetical protein